MRRITFSLIVLSLLGGVVALVAPSAEAGITECELGEFEVRGRVTDASTGLPLDEVTSVELHTVEGPLDGFGTEPDSRYSFCVPNGTYFIKFVADHYKAEWWDDQPNSELATPLVVDGDAEVGINAALTPKGRVFTGRVTNANGRVVFASVDVWRRNPVTRVWSSYDGIANDLGRGFYKFTAPGPGLYRVAAFVDFHHARWHNSVSRFRFATTINLQGPNTLVTGVNIKVPYCPASDGGAFCIPPGFYT